MDVEETTKLLQVPCLVGYMSLVGYSKSALVVSLEKKGISSLSEGLLKEY